jgi:hypothetical protein
MRRLAPCLVVIWVAAAQGPSALADTVTYVVDPGTGNEEWRVSDDASGHHYLSVVQTPDGAVSIRPHPGDDPNGWGSTPYINVHQQGSLEGGQVDDVSSAGHGVNVSASGAVATPSGTPNGQWTSNWTLSYDRSARTASGTGQTRVELDNPLDYSGNDLTVAHIASNRLRNVPLVGGGTGNTGDMRVMNVTSPGWSYTWDPLIQGSSFPQDVAANVTLEMIGEYNRVDGDALGHGLIEPAYKPTVTVGVEAVTPGLQVITGGVFDPLEETNPFADNVAGLGVVRHGDFSGLVLDFVYDYESVAVPEPGSAALAAIGFMSVLVVRLRLRRPRQRFGAKRRAAR